MNETPLMYFVLILKPEEKAILLVVWLMEWNRVNHIVVH